MRNTVEYEIYHDESKEGGYWHSFVFIPTDNKNKIVKHLLDVKDVINKNIKDVSFKDIKNKAKKKHDKPKLIRYWLSYIIAGLQQQKKINMLWHIYVRLMELLILLII